MTAPRLGFLGLGWIGRHRMRALATSGVAEVAALVDPDPECLAEARAIAPSARVWPSFERMLESDLDGIVIATPSALHSGQAMAALDRGMAVFCQKPLAPTAQACRRTLERARARDRLLGVDFSYRYLVGMRRIRECVRDGTLGRVYAASLVFHNAYGPDKDWFYRRAEAGGGCVTDLGIHLIDLALWMLDFPAIEGVESRCYVAGNLLRSGSDAVEDYASVRLDLAGGVAVDLACSWHLPVGQDADIRVGVYGTEAGAALANVGGSFYDFRTQLCHGTACESLCEPDEEGEWGGRALIDWARRLAVSPRFDERAAQVVAVAEAIDRIYDGNGCSPRPNHG